MKKTTKRFDLGAQTIRNLTAAPLRGVRGGQARISEECTANPGCVPTDLCDRPTYTCPVHLTDAGYCTVVTGFSARCQNQ